MNTLLKAVAGIVSAGVCSVAVADTVSPSSYSATLGVDESVSITKTVTVSQTLTTGAVDIFFLADTTGSMGGAIGSVRSNAASLLSSTASYGDVRWAVGEYKDFLSGDPYGYLLNQTFTSVQTNVLAAINTWSASGGGDWPEAQLNALTQASTLGWRTGATHILVWFGDAPGHDPSNGATLASTEAALTAKNIKVEAVEVGSLDAYGQATAIADATGGTFFSSYSGSVGTAIGTAIGSAIAHYSSVCVDASGVPAGVNVVTGSCITGTFDRTSERTFEIPVTFTGVTPGTYEFVLPIKVDGGIVASERDTITVTSGGTVPEPGTLLLVGAALAAIGGSRRARQQK